MKSIKEISKDMIIAGLGTVDSQNDEIKDLLRRGEEVLGMGHVDNEELRWNGNKDELDSKKSITDTPESTVIEITAEITKGVDK